MRNSEIGLPDGTKSFVAESKPIIPLMHPQSEIGGQYRMDDLAKALLQIAVQQPAVREALIQGCQDTMRGRGQGSGDGSNGAVDKASATLTRASQPTNSRYQSGSGRRGGS